MEDDHLLAAVANADATALRELYDRHAPWLAARLRRALPAEGVEDALQETFIAAWRGARSYQGDGAVGAWLWGIAHRQAALWARSRGQPVTALAKLVLPGTDDPATEAVRAADLARALATLGPEGSDGRELVRLVYIEDRPLAEVAHLLGIPQGTVKSRLFTLRRRLRAVLRGEIDDADS